MSVIDPIEYCVSRENITLVGLSATISGNCSHFISIDACWYFRLAADMQQMTEGKRPHCNEPMRSNFQLAAACSHKRASFCPDVKLNKKLTTDDFSPTGS